MPVEYKRYKAQQCNEDPLAGRSKLLEVGDSDILDNFDSDVEASQAQYQNEVHSING